MIHEPGEREEISKSRRRKVRVSRSRAVRMVCMRPERVSIIYPPYDKFGHRYLGIDYIATNSYDYCCCIGPLPLWLCDTTASHIACCFGVPVGNNRECDILLRSPFLVLRLIKGARIRASTYKHRPTSMCASREPTAIIQNWTESGIWVRLSLRNSEIVVSRASHRIAGAHLAASCRPDPLIRSIAR